MRMMNFIKNEYSLLVHLLIIQQVELWGQMFACKSLIQSSLSDCTDWVLIDTTAESNGHISFITRIRKALFRLSKFIYHILFSRIDICLIFTADGFSFWRKD